MPFADPVKEAERLMIICNACRYCEGHCAVFPAMELRTVFPNNDLIYLANLCHNCGSCYHHCQYAPPHEFSINIPKTFAELRAQSYRRYAWPAVFSGLFERSGLATGAITAVSFGLLMLLSLGLVGPSVLSARHLGSGAFYAILPHDLMVVLFGAVSLYVLGVLAVGFLRFWRDMGESPAGWVASGPFARAVWDALRLRYLDGGADGCTYPQEAPSRTRRWFHHLTFYGFLSCFAATSVAAFYEYVFGWEAPYPLWSLPVVLGTLGGIGLLIGPVGLLWLKLRSDPEPNRRDQFPMDVAFLLLLFLTSLTGLILLALRTTPAMGSLLVLHLGFVLGLFLTLPYGKFVHAIYRFAALIRYAIERSRPVPRTAQE